MQRTPAERISVAAIRGFAGVATAIAVGWILTRAGVPEGRLSTTGTFDGPAPFLSEPKPSDRVKPESEGENRLHEMLSSTVLLDFTPPSRFDTARVSVEYVTAAPVVEIGALASTLDSAFAVRTVRHAALDALDWPHVAANGLTLYQRRTTFASVADFLANPPALENIASWHADVPNAVRIPAYEPYAEPHRTVASLRGGHTFLTYAKDEPVAFTFYLQDMNRELGPDDVRVAVYPVGSEQALGEASLDDDGNVSDDQIATGLLTLELSVDVPREGAYRVVFSTSDDVFIREYDTRQKDVVLEKHVYFGDMVGYSANVPVAEAYVTGTTATVLTPHAEGMQTASVGGVDLALTQPLHPYPMTLSPDGLTPVIAPKRNIRIDTDGVVALSVASAFDAVPVSIGSGDTSASLAARGIDYVLAAYDPGAHPSRGDGVMEGSATFALDELRRTKAGAYRFAVLVPGAPETRAALKSFTVEATRDGGAVRGIFGGQPLPEPSFTARAIPYLVLLPDRAE